MKVIYYSILFGFFGCIQIHANAQKGVYDTIRVSAFITEQGDTIPESWLPTVELTTQQSAANKAKWASWTRLRNAVYVTYPYALTAGVIINDVNGQLRGVSDPKERKRIIKLREKDLKRDFADKVTQLSVYQGKVLMKLINRETGNSCYEIIKDYKGGFNAGVWQTVAFLFGSSLKQPYSPNGEDMQIEIFVKEVRKLYGFQR